MFRAKRVYDPVDPADGTRILVDRLWPRGISKDDAGFIGWMPEVAPSNQLRQWFDHDPDRWSEFIERYARELEDAQDDLERLREFERERGTVTLCYSARDEEYNHAVALTRFLEAESQASNTRDDAHAA